MATVAYKDNIIILGGQSFPDNYQSGRRGLLAPAKRRGNVRHSQSRMQAFAIHAPGKKCLCSCDYG